MSGNPAHRPPTLSVIIPAFNEAQTIRQVVEAVKEIPIDTEIIVVNDGSTDETSEILDQMCDELKLKILQCKENRGKGQRFGLDWNRSPVSLWSFKMLTLNSVREI